MSNFLKYDLQTRFSRAKDGFLCQKTLVDRNQRDINFTRNNTSLFKNHVHKNRARPFKQQF